MRVSIPMIVAEGSRIKNVVFLSNRNHFSLFSSFDLKFGSACIAVNKNDGSTISGQWSKAYLTD